MVDYRAAGVDIEAGNEVVRRIKRLAAGTFTPGVLSEIGSFGGLFRFGAEAYREPVLVASADGVGTKLKVAVLANRHDTVGTDLVNHCVNDILVQGAEPLFFLDYLATGRLQPDVAVEIVEGVAAACRENGCALLGGETAEMPGLYADGDYDLAGFVVGVVERARLIDGRNVRDGDALIGIPSSGLHTNGYSLARHIFFDRLGLSVDDPVDELGCTVGEELLRVHRSYLPLVRPLLAQGVVHAMAHITGGGLTDNVPRVLGEGLGVEIDVHAWTPPPVFEFMRRAAGVPFDDLYRTFNMGVGLVILCDEGDAPAVLSMLSGAGETGACVIGRVRAGVAGVRYPSAS